MPTQRIIIDEARLKQNVLAYLRSPAAEPVFQELAIPFYLCCIMAAVLLCAGMCMLPTVIWTLAGVEMLWSLLKLEPFKPAFENPRQKAESLVPLIGHGIIIGPDRSQQGMPKRFGLVLGSFQSLAQCPPDWLAQNAKAFAQMYLDRSGSIPREEEAIRALLADDHYRPNRRRPVPEPQAQRCQLWLFDAELEVEQGRETPFATVLFAFVADPGEKGELIQIPWSVVQDAVAVLD
jgi:hypothetical protein